MIFPEVLDCSAQGLQPLELLSCWGPNLLAGLWNSILIALGAYALGLTIGIGGAYGKLYGSPLTKDLLAVYTTVVRAVPELVLILILYFAVTDALNRLVIALGGSGFEISGVAAGIAVLGVVQGAYATEVLRGAIQAVPTGQVEAGRAMGMSGMQVARRIVLPLMLAFAIPGMSNLWLIVTKDTALLAIVGFSELTQATRQAASTTKAFFTFYAAAGLMYLALSIISTLLFARIEKWARRGQRRTGD